MEAVKFKSWLKNILYISILILISCATYGQNAPVTKVASILSAVPGEQVTVPITVNGFQNIGGFTLALDYDFSKLNFVSGTKNSLLGGTFDIGDIDLGNGFHRLTVSWFKSGDGVTLTDGSSIVDYVFTFISGPATLNWFDIGPSCVYNDPQAKTLNDTPASAFYYNGLVADTELPKPTISANGTTTFFEGENVTLTSSAGFGYLWSTGETTSSIVVNESGNFTVQTRNEEGLLSESSEPVTVSVISVGTTQLNYRLNNPRILNQDANDYFEFDVELKADAEGTWIWKGQISLKFNTTSFSSGISNWEIIPDGQFNKDNSFGTKKYAFDLSMDGMNLNIAFKGNEAALNSLASENNFVEVSTEYKTLVTIRCLILSNTGMAGITFNESKMNGKQFYKLSTLPWFASYANLNQYNPFQFADCYIGRIYSLGQWTQAQGLSWSKAVNTSVWNGQAMIPGQDRSNASHLRIHETGTLTIPSNGKVSVYGNTEIKSPGKLIITSDSTGIGSLITASSKGSAVIQKHQKSDAWHLISSPLSGQNISTFLSDNENITLSGNLNERQMTDFNPETNDWNLLFSTSIVGDLETGIGYKVHFDDSGSINFEGSLQTGDLSVNGFSEKWNCFGNPYSSAIRINSGSSGNSDFLDKNAGNLDPVYGAIYIWNQPNINNGNTESYKAVSKASDLTDIQQGQAFFVKLKAGVSSVNFVSSMQIHHPEMEIKSKGSSNPTIKIIAKSNSTVASTNIALINGMTKGLDVSYDAGLLKGNSDLEVYTRLVEDNGELFAIQALPLSNYSQLVIPIGIDLKTGGEVVFSAASANLPVDCKVLLEDKEKKIITNLSEKEYLTVIESNSSILDRFILHTSYLTTGIKTNLILENLNAYAISNTKLIVQGDLSENSFILLYDMQGRIVFNGNLNSGTFNEVNVPSLKSGVYILHVRDNNKVKNIKIAIIE